MTEQMGPLYQPGVDPNGEWSLERPPEAPPHGPAVWMRQNLFSSVGNSVLTLIFVGISLGILRWVLGMIFSDERNWDAVTTNLRTLFTFNYPVEQFARVWFVVGAIVVAAGVSMVAWGADPRLPVRKLGTSLMGLGGFFVVVAILAPTSNEIRIGFLVVAAVLAVLGLIAYRLAGEGKADEQRTISFPAMVVAFAVAVVVVVWTVPFGRNVFADGEIINEPGTVSLSTKGPWTVMAILLVASFFGARLLARRIDPANLRTAMVLWWVVGPAFLLFLVLRDPQFDWGYVLSVDLPIALAFIVGGGLLLWVITDPERPELATAVGAIVLGIAIFTFLAAFVGWFGMLQKIRLSLLFLAMFSFAANTFTGERRTRIQFILAWAGFVTLSHWLITGINTPSTLEIAAPPFIGGFLITVTIAYYVMLASFPLGTLLALARTSKLPIFRVLSTAYIEVIRGIPLITVLFFFSIMVPLFLPDSMDLSELAAIFVGYSLFSAAYMAENIRGGLQSVRRGQYEAADALGLTTAQRTAFIVLPQAYRVSIPNLVGQAIATFKETSLIAVVGGFDLLRVANQTVPSQPEFLGQSLTTLFFVSAVYWVFAYSMSRASRNLEAKLGVGTR